MYEWNKLVDSLGKNEKSIEFLDLMSSIGENPILSEDLIEYNDPDGHTKYYKYIQSGIEIGFRKGVLNHMHFYFDGYENYAVFKGELLSGICSGWNEKSVVQVLG